MADISISAGPSVDATPAALHAPPAGQPAIDPAINRSRNAATAALGITFPADAAVGYAGRSMVFFATDAVLKVYTHRSAERAHREHTGLAVARRHVVALQIPRVLGLDDGAAGPAWVATTRLPGHQPTTDQLRTPAGASLLGQIAARLHAVPARHLAALRPYTRRIRPVPDLDTTISAAAGALDRALAAADGSTRLHRDRRCGPGFVHGDLSSRNVLLPDTVGGQLVAGAAGTAGVIDFEGSGIGCVYDDLATLVMHDGLLGPAAPRQILAGYESERAAGGHRAPGVDQGHLALHLTQRARWVLQWAVEVDRPLAEQVLALLPDLLDDLERT